MNIFLKRQLLVCLLLSLMSVSAFAKTKVVVVPLGDETKNISNIITVAKKGGDFTNLIDAINSIVSANANNQYLIYIAPGVYNLSTPLIMKNFVHVQGAGSNMTEIVGSFNSTAYCNKPVVDGYSHFSFSLSGYRSSSISGLTIKNYGGAGASRACGIKNSVVKLHDLAVYVQGGSTSNIAIYSDGGQASYKNIELQVQTLSNATNATKNIGMHIEGSAIVENAKITFTGKGENNGIFGSLASGLLKNLDIYIHHNVGGTSYGIKHIDGIDQGNGFIIRNSYIRGTTAAVYSSDGSNFAIHHSSLKGGFQKQAGGRGTTRCFYSDDTNIELDTNCSVPVIE